MLSWDPADWVEVGVGAEAAVAVAVAVAVDNPIVVWRSYAEPGWNAGEGVNAEVGGECLLGRDWD